MDIPSWTSSIDLETPAGRLLRAFAVSLPRSRTFSVTVFGSAPIQIMVDPRLLSADIDVFSSVDELDDLVKKAGFAQGQTDFYIQVSTELNFRTSPRWRGRTQSVTIETCTFVFPHLIDILIAKLNRLDEKDLEAFRVVIARTGHPTEAELIEELQMAVDLFRPNFDEENAGDLVNNTRRLWPLIYGREIDPRREIIAPALAKRKAGYGEPSRDYKQELREMVRAYGQARPVK